MKERNKQTAKYWRDLLEQYKMALLVLAVGIFLMLLPTAAGGREQSETTVEEGFDLASFERRLEQTLSNIEGAGKTRVMLSVKSDGQQILAQNVERDGERTTSTTVTLGKGGSTQEVVALQKLGPQFQGAVVVCPGGEDPQVRLALAQAVGAVTGLGSDRISICKGT